MSKTRKCNKAASRWHLQGMELLPQSPLDSNLEGMKSPLDSSPLAKEKRGEGTVILRKVI